MLVYAGLQNTWTAANPSPACAPPAKGPESRGLGMSNDANLLGPPLADRRRHPRRRVLLAGAVCYADGSGSFSCTIRDLSEGGARITIPSGQIIPSSVFLVCLRDRVAYRARLAWNTGTEAGLAFLKSYPLAELTDAPGEGASRP
jgi:PilZ domain-containing protein